MIFPYWTGPVWVLTVPAEIRAIEDRLEHVEAELADQTTRFVAQTMELADSREEVAEIIPQLIILWEERDAAKEKVQALEHNVENLRQMFDVSSGNVANLQEQREADKLEIRELKEKREADKLEIREMKEKREIDRVETAELKAEVAELRAQHEADRVEMADLKEKLEAALQRISRIAEILPSPL